MSQRQHEPTPARLRRARRDGDVVVSHDLAHAIALTGSFVVLSVLAAPLALTLLHLAQVQFQNVAAPLSDGMVSANVLADLINAALPLFAAFVAVGWFGQGVQRGFRWNATSLTWSWQRLNPRANFQRVGGDSAAQVIACLKSLLLLWLIGLLLWKEIPGLLTLGQLPPLGLTITLTGITLRLATTLSLAFIGVGLLDYLWQRVRHRRRLRMTPEELQDEARQEAGGRRRR